MEPFKIVLLQDHKNSLDNQSQTHSYKKRFQKSCCLIDQNLVHKEPAETRDDETGDHKEKSHQKHIHYDRLHACHPLADHRDYGLFLSLADKRFTFGELKHHSGIGVLEISYGNNTPPHAWIVYICLFISKSFQHHKVVHFPEYYGRKFSF